MTALILTLKLEAPLLITGISNGEENSSRSLPYIPGSALRGALISRINCDDIPLSPAGKIFFSGAVRFLNAYPLDQDGKRMLPTPASWYTKKGEGTENVTAADLAFGQNSEKDKPIKKNYIGKTGNQDYAFSLEEEIAVHIASEGERGVVKSGTSAVFQYQSLALGQKFRALIVADEPSDLDEIEKLLTPRTLYLGRSRSSGYGKVLIEDFQRTDEQEAESTLTPVTVITLLSDLILRDEHGQPTHDLDGYLSKRLGKSIKNQNAFVNTTEVGGFNRKWKLPLPQMPALSMGSVFVYSAAQLSPADLADMVTKGIGERRVDGFGRIVVNWHGNSHPELGEEKESTPPKEEKAKTHPLSETSKDLARKMSERLARHALEQNLVTEVQKYEVSGNITNHQLARLRGILRFAIDSEEKNFGEVTKFFEKLKKSARDSAKKQWQNSRLKKGKETNARLQLWIEERAKKIDGLEILNFGKALAVAGVSMEADEKFKREYTLRLMEAMLNSVMKSNRGAA